MSLPAPSRRSVIAGAAWSVPAVAVASASPAFATSTGGAGGQGGTEQCATYTLKWASADDLTRAPGLDTVEGNLAYEAFTVSAVLTNDGVAPAGSAPSEEVVILVAYSGDVVSSPGNRSVVATQFHHGAEMALQIQQKSKFGKALNPTSDFQSILVKFKGNVSEVHFRIQDVDAVENQFWDTVAVSPKATATAVGAHPKYAIAGEGTREDPVYCVDPNLNTEWPKGSSPLRGGEVAFSINEDTDRFAIIYSNKATPSVEDGKLEGITHPGNQGMFLGPITYVRDVCV